MNRMAVIGAALLSLAFLALLSPFILHPVLYTFENESSTPYQANPAALEQLSQEKSADLSALMQDILDAPQPIVLNIKIRDFEEAERAFEEYREQSRSFDSLVVSLELSESAVGDFQRENRKNLAALERMINESAQFDEINRLEIRYRSEDNPTLLYSVIYEGEAVHQALSKTSGQFREREPDILGISRELGLNATRYQEAVDTLEEIVEADRVRQEERAASQPVLNPSTLTLSVSPLTGTYGDTLQVTGTHTFMRLTEVVLILDSRDWKTVRPDENGIFRTTLPIGRIRSGIHVLFATSGDLYSNIMSFTIGPSDTTLSLECDPAGSEVACTGSLFAGEVPVKNAPVRILVDGSDQVQAETAADGTYAAVLTLAEGDRTLQAVFDGEGYPLNPSESVIRTVTISPVTPLPLAVLVGIGFMGIASLGAFWYLRRQARAPVTRPAEEAEADAAPALSDQEPPLPLPIDVLISYQDLVAAGKGSEAAHLLHRSLIGRLFPRIIDPSAKTPRELLALLMDSSPAVPFRSFINRYEEVRYGGLPIKARDPLLSHWNEVLALLEEGSHA
jgi:hypothetical protein